MRICSFENPRICASARVANACNTHRLNALIAYLNPHIDTPQRRQSYTPWRLQRKRELARICRAFINL
jgi:hypothetical protein